MRVFGVAILVSACAASLIGCQSLRGDSEEASASEMKAFDDPGSAPLELAHTDDPQQAGADAAAAGGETKPEGAATPPAAAPEGGDPLTGADPQMEGPQPLAEATQSPMEATPTKAEPAAAGDYGKRYSLGPLAEDDMKLMVYHTLEQRLAKTQSVGVGVEEATEIGDLDSFKFTIVKLVRGADDVSGSASETPDGMDIEVTGWFKRTARSEDVGAKVACTSFDATVSVVRAAGEWRAQAAQPGFGREDSEDCY